MFDFNHYVPIFKAKQGEFRALQNISERTKNKLTPFFDIPRQESNDRRSLEAYLSTRALNLSKAVANFDFSFVDFYDLALDLRTSHGQHYLDYFFSELSEHNTNAIPVLGLDRDQNYLDSIHNLLKEDINTICIRLLDNDIATPGPTNEEINKILDVLKIRPCNVHLLLDFRNISDVNVSEKKEDTVDFLKKLNEINAWLTLIISASSFPENLSEVERYSEKLIPRLEFKLWKQILTLYKNRQIERLPTFSDYCICHPDLLDFRPEYNPSVSIRYTLEEHWLILKQAGLKRKVGERTVYDFSQFHSLSNRLRGDRRYFGPEYSYGDKYIYDCARRRVKKGRNGFAAPLVCWQRAIGIVQLEEGAMGSEFGERSCVGLRNLQIS